MMDVSGSMYRFNGKDRYYLQHIAYCLIQLNATTIFDRRLERMLEAALLVLHYIHGHTLFKYMCMCLGVHYKSMIGYECDTQHCGQRVISQCQHRLCSDW